MQIKICDICATRKDIKDVYLPYDRRMDAAGGMETISNVFDLCCSCYLSVLQKTLKEGLKLNVSLEDFNLSEWKFNSMLIEEIKRRIKRYNASKN